MKFSVSRFVQHLVLLPLAVMFAACAIVSGPPERSFDNNTLTSVNVPTITLKIDPAFSLRDQALSTIEKGNVDVEHYYFEDASGELKRILLVRFYSYNQFRLKDVELDFSPTDPLVDHRVDLQNGQVAYYHSTYSREFQKEVFVIRKTEKVGRLEEGLVLIDYSERVSPSLGSFNQERLTTEQKSFLANFTARAENAFSIMITAPGRDSR